MMPKKKKADLVKENEELKESRKELIDTCKLALHYIEQGMTGGSFMDNLRSVIKKEESKCH